MLSLLAKFGVGLDADKKAMRIVVLAIRRLYKLQALDYLQALNYHVTLHQAAATD